MADPGLRPKITEALARHHKPGQPWPLLRPLINQIVKEVGVDAQRVETVVYEQYQKEKESGSLKAGSAEKECIVCGAPFAPAVYNDYIQRTCDACTEKGADAYDKMAAKPIRPAPRLQAAAHFSLGVGDTVEVNRKRGVISHFGPLGEPVIEFEDGSGGHYQPSVVKQIKEGYRAPKLLVGDRVRQQRTGYSGTITSVPNDNQVDVRDDRFPRDDPNRYRWDRYGLDKI